MDTRDKNSVLQPVLGRNIAALLNPRPLAIIGCILEDTTNFTTVAWITPLSHDPALVGFAIRPTSYTLHMIKEAGCFSVNLCDPQLAETARLCGSTSGHTQNKGELVSHTSYLLPVQSNKVSDIGPFPFIDGALSALSCKLESMQETGDHCFVVAKIIEAFSRCLVNEKGELLSPETLLCLQRDTFVLTEKGHTI